MSEFGERDWKQLLPELIHLIAKKLPDIVNFIRFRSVCKTWQFSAPLSDPPTQFPWIYEDIDDSAINRHDTRSSADLRFYSISSTETFMINVKTPDTDRNETYCMGLCCHNIPFIYHRVPFDEFDDYAELYLHNPLTKKQIVFERIPLLFCKPVIVWNGTNPLCDRSMLIVDEDMHCRNPEVTTSLVLFDPQRKNWIVHKGSFCNAFLCQEMLFAVEKNGYTIVYDLSLKMLSHKIPPPNDKEVPPARWQKHCTYIVEFGGIILRVSWIINDRYREIVGNFIFSIYKLKFDRAKETPCWVRLDNIGNQVLFLDENIAFSMSTRPSTGFKEGCIYFISPYYRKPYVYDVLSGTIERVPVPSSFKCCSWFVPGLC